MEIPTRQNHVYTLTCDNACDVYDVDTGTLIHQHHAGEVQSQFTAIGMKSETTDDTAILTELFNGATAGNGSGGGYIESNLNVGHGAADAVAAVCTLTLGDPTAEGTLMDNSTPVAAGASVTPLVSYAAGTTYDMGIGDDPSVPALFMFSWTPGDAAAAQDFVDALNDLDNWWASPPLETPLVHAVLDGESGEVVLTLAESGAAGNSLFVMVESAYNPPIQETEDVSFSGGADRRALHLDAAPATYAHDFWAMTHPTAGGVLVVGDHTFAEVEEKAERAASISLALGSSRFVSFKFGVKYQVGDLYELYEFVWNDVPEEVTPEDLKTALNDADNWIENGERMAEAPFVATWDSTTERMTLTALAKSGDDGNNLTYEAYTMTPFEEPDDPDFSGGQDARTLDEALELAVSTINKDEDSPIRAEIGEDAQGNKGIAVYALEAGSGHNYDCWNTTGIFFNINTYMSYDGDDARTLDEVIAAINGDDGEGEPTYPFGAKAEATETEGVITLTANTAGKAANAVVYTSTGCFGGETVKQGSTTRGKNAVEQTDYEIVLNGGAPQPLDLTSTEPLKNGHVYTLAVAGDTDLSALTVKQYATAEIWVRIGAITFNVSLPDTWVWVNGAASDMTGKTNTTFCIAVRNDGVKVLASIAYSYDTTPAQS